MAEADTRDDVTQPAWRQRAVSRSLSAARSRAEQRIQRFLDAAFELMDEKGTTDFTIQEVVDRSKQSLRGFYVYFAGRDELLLALFEEMVREAAEDLRGAVESESEPLARVRAFTIRLHEWCEPSGPPSKRGAHDRLPVSEFSLQLAIDHPEQVSAAMAPISRLLVELLDAAVAAGAIQLSDTRRAAQLVQQTVMYSWLANRLVRKAEMCATAQETWEFCLHGLHA